MDTIPETFESYFNKLYNKKTYLDKYGGSVVATGVTLLIFFCIFSYFLYSDKNGSNKTKIGLMKDVNQK